MAQVVVEMSGDEAKLFRSYQKIIDQSKKLEQSTKDNKRVAEESFGASMQSALGAYVGKLSGATAAVGALVAVLRSAKQEAEATAQAMRSYGPAFGQLAQLAGNRGDLQRLVGASKSTYMEGGARSLAEASALQFALESVGAGGMRADFSRMQATGLVPDARLMAESASMLQKAFGTAETGDFRQIVSKAFGGGVLGIGTAEQLLGGAAKVGVQASRLKLSDEEALAAVATASATLGPDEAATSIQALLKSIETDAVGSGRVKSGQSLTGYLSAIQALEAKGVNIRTLLGGRQEAIVGYGLLTNAEGSKLYGQNLGNIQRAQSEDWMGQRLALAAGVPENRMAMTAQQIEAGRTLAGERNAMLKTAADALQRDMEIGYEKRYGIFGRAGETFGRVGGRMAASADRLYGYRDAGFIADREGEWASPQTKEVIQMWRDAAAGMQQAAKNMETVTGRQRASANMQPE